MQQALFLADTVPPQSHHRPRGLQAMQFSSVKRSLFAAFATALIGSVSMSSADAASLAGAWSLDGVPAPSGTATMTAHITDLPKGRCRLSLPGDLRLAVGSADVVLHPKSNGAYSAKASSGSEITLTVKSQGHARLVIAGKPKFEVMLTRISN
jgi:hypothetical protein